PQLLITPVQKKKRICITTRVITPLAAAPATERSERVGEEAEDLRWPALCTYAPATHCAQIRAVKIFMAIKAILLHRADISFFI
ncbi:hypothetical protein, partial [Escherichia coli]|uniref:hypothetical protein n=1 Tax=Escherichia coli TaxID=562 RepID=UPI003C2E9D67